MWPPAPGRAQCGHLGTLQEPPRGHYLQGHLIVATALGSPHCTHQPQGPCHSGYHLHEHQLQGYATTMATNQLWGHLTILLISFWDTPLLTSVLGDTAPWPYHDHSHLWDTSIQLLDPGTPHQTHQLQECVKPPRASPRTYYQVPSCPPSHLMHFGTLCPLSTGTWRSPGGVEGPTVTTDSWEGNITATSQLGRQWGSSG